MSFYYQQGDVVIKLIKMLPVGISHHDCDDGVIQWGEVTNHSHRLMFRHDATATKQCEQWELFKSKNGTRYLKVLEPTDLKHEEHKTITIPPGEYEIGIVREYDHFAEEARQVQD